MERTRPDRGTFVVQILNRQNEEWQGTITWTDEGKSIPFRSMLELLGLIDSAVGGKETT